MHELLIGKFGWGIVMRLLISVLLLSISSSVWADFHQTPVDINRIGSHDGYTFYLQLKQPLSTACAFNTLYCPNSKPDCKSMMSIALAAKTAAKPIDVSYNIDANNICMIWLLSLP